MDLIDIPEDKISTGIDTSKSKKKKSGGFQSMNLISSVYKAVMNKGFNVPTPIQRRAIPLIMEGRDVIVSSKTGSGKTAAYMIPLINKLKAHSMIVGARALILLPTRELALQTAAVFKQFAKLTDLVHSVIVGGHGLEGQYESLASNPDVIIATPGRLMQHLTETNYSLSKVESLIIDEADFIFEKGFGDQLKVVLQKVSNNRQTILLSATIPEEVSKFAAAGLKDYVFVKLDSEYTISDTMTLHFLLTKPHQKISTLLYILKNIIKPDEKSIVFASTRYHVDLLLEILKKFELEAVGIYGKMDQLSRKDQIMKFRGNKCNILVVTDLAARGIDIPFVNNVINWDYPQKSKIFIHRSGRTARAGRLGTTYTILSSEEICYLAEIQIYIGRSLSSEYKENDNSKAYYGKVPDNALSDYDEALQIIFDKDLEIQKFQELSNNGIKLFKKTRASASKASKQRSKAINFDVLHPLFKDLRLGKETEEFYNKIKDYRPKEGLFEFKQARGQMIINEEALKFIKEAKKIKFKKMKEQELKENSSMGQAGVENQSLEVDNNNRSSSLEDEDESKREGEGDNSNEDDIMDEDEDEEGKGEEKTKSHEEIGAVKARVGASSTSTLLKKRNHEDHTKGLDIGLVVSDGNVLKSRKVKKSQMSDFRNPEQFISYEASKENTLFGKDKITPDDVIPFIVADDVDDLKKQQKKYKWDKTKKRYITQDMGRDKKSKFKRDNEDTRMREDKGKKSFRTWSKRNMISYQKVGDIENKDLTQRAKQLFLNRRKKFVQPIEANDTKGKKGNNNRSRGRNELKRPDEILKTKRKNKNKVIKNTERSKRQQHQGKKPRR